MMKKLMAMLLMLMLCVGMATVAHAADTHTHAFCGGTTCPDAANHSDHTSVTYQAWDGTTDIHVTSGTAAYYLTDDVEINQTTQNMQVAKGATLYLCLNGKTLTKGNTLYVSGKLYLCDCAGEGKITRIDVDGYYPHGVSVSATGAMYMYGGEITGHYITGANGAGIWNEGILRIYGGKITNNKVTQYRDSFGHGGGVASYGHLYIYGGEFSGNEAYHAGAVYVCGDHATDVFEMTGGLIDGNKATASDGGIWINGEKAMTATITGGTISNNTAVFSCGGLAASGSVKLSISGVTFSGNGNTGNGGGGAMYLTTTESVLVENCTFTGNTAGKYGGAIYMGSNCKVELKNLTISGNNAGTGGGGIATSGSGHQVLIHNCTITGNTSTDVYGGGVYISSAGVTFSGNTTVTGNTADSKNSNVFLGSGASGTNASKVPQVTEGFTGNVGVSTLYTVEQKGPQAFIANAAGGAVTAAQLARFTSDLGYAKRVNSDGRGEFFIGYSVTVVNGTSDNTDYEKGATVTIAADAAETGMKFSSWTSNDGVTFADAKANTTTFTMPAKSVTVTANFVKCYHTDNTSTPTPNQDGTHSFTCSVCGEVVTNPHTFGTSDTCVCGEKAGAKLQISSEITYYATIDDALDEIPDFHKRKATVTLLKDGVHEKREVFPDASEVTLELNGYDLAMNKGISLKGSKDILTIKDSKGTSTITCNVSQAFYVYDGGILTINSGNFVGGPESIRLIAHEDGELTINGGTFINQYGEVVYIHADRISSSDNNVRTVKITGNAQFKGKDYEFSIINNAKLDVSKATNPDGWRVMGANDRDGNGTDIIPNTNKDATYKNLFMPDDYVTVKRSKRLQ